MCVQARTHTTKFNAVNVNLDYIIAHTLQDYSSACE